jgi:hypothetical protein
MKMDALSFWQPWASLVVFEYKKVETRVWKPPRKAPFDLAIAATKSDPPKGIGVSRLHYRFIRMYCGLPGVERLGAWACWPQGCVIGTVRVLGWERTEVCRDDLSEQELTFGNYEDGRWAWFMELDERFEKPIPCRGNRLLWEWNRTQG